MEGVEYFVVWFMVMFVWDSVWLLWFDDEVLLRSWRRTMRFDYFDYEIVFWELF